MQGSSCTRKFSLLVTQVSAGSSVVDSVNMVNPVLKKKRQMGEEDVTIRQEWKQSSTKPDSHTNKNEQNLSDQITQLSTDID